MTVSNPSTIGGASVSTGITTRVDNTNSGENMPYPNVASKAVGSRSKSSRTMHTADTVLSSNSNSDASSSSSVSPRPTQTTMHNSGHENGIPHGNEHGHARFHSRSHGLNESEFVDDPQPEAKGSLVARLAGKLKSTDTNTNMGVTDNSLVLPYPEDVAKSHSTTHLRTNGNDTAHANANDNYSESRSQVTPTKRPPMVTDDDVFDDNNPDQKQAAIPTSAPNLPYEDAGLPVRKTSFSGSKSASKGRNIGGDYNTNKTKKKSRIKLGAKLMKLRKKRDSKYKEIIKDEEVGTANGAGTGTGMRTSSMSHRYRSPEELTDNGNSLPDLGPSRKRQNPFSQLKNKISEKIHVIKVEKDENENACANFCCYLLFFFFILGSLILAFGTSSSPLHHEAHPFPPEPTRPPSIFHDGTDNGPSGHGDFTVYQWKLHQKFSSMSSVDIDTPYTPHNRAAQWMIHQDEMGYGVESPYLLQRFILAIFYYKITETDRCFDLNESIDECQWDRIDCDENGYVVQLNFENCNIGGSIPSELPWGFDKLQTLDLSGNRFVGRIPSELEMLKNLKSLYLERNPDLEGEVPDLLCRHKEQGILIDFTVQCDGENSKVDCECCDHCNGVHGGIPTNNSNIDIELNERQKLVLNKLKVISGNEVTETGSPQNQAAYWIIEEDEGKYPAESDFLYQRYVLALLHFMMGDSSLSTLKKNSSLDECNWDGVLCNGDGHVIDIKFASRRITGPIPMELKVLHNLSYLDLSSNNLTGGIPTGLSLLDSLESLLLDNNQIEGIVPDQLCSRHKSGELAHFRTDCGEGGKVECECCDSCSNASTWSYSQKNTWSNLHALSGDSVSDPSTIQYKAVKWILEEDKWHYESTSTFLYQRYVLVLMYYMMGDDSWFTPGSRTDECKWERVGCNHEGFIEHLEFDGCYMSGSIPTELKALKDLKYLDLSSNSLSGEVPTELSTLTKLETLLLDSNNIDGSIPENLCVRHDSGNLQKIQVDCQRGSVVGCRCCDCSGTSETDGTNTWSYNQKATWSMLESLSGDKLLDSNTPQYKAALWIVDEDKWHYPAASSFLHQRYVLVLMYNMMGDQDIFTPDLDHDECKWERVGCNHEGYVEHIQFDKCKMSGTIPTELGTLDDLKYLDLSYNNLSGEVPPELGLLTRLETLFLESNNIQGEVPNEVCKRHNQGSLSQISTDCKSNNHDKVACDCCFNCPISQVNVDKQSCTEDSVINFDETNIEGQERTKQIKRKCIELSGDAICQHNTPQNLAMRWLIYDDKLKLDVTSPDFVQRYVVAVIYFSLGPDGWVDSFWLSTNQDECEIPGVICDTNMHIISLEFADTGMEGVLPAEISHLSELIHIDVSDNEIDGGIPPSWVNLKNLESLDLTYNDMTGAVSENICSLRNNGVNSKLISLKVDCEDVQCNCCDGCNDGAGGSTVQMEPREMEIRKKAQSISFRSSLYEPIRLKALTWIINVDEMQLDADSVGFDERFVLALFYFAMDGSNWSIDANEHGIWLNNTPFCSWVGIICDDKNEKLEAIRLTRFNLKGELPYELGSLTDLRVINISSNDVTGSIPDEFSNLSNLSILYLYDNNLNGEIPVCDLRTEDKLNDLWVDCDKLSCPKDCCTKCGELASKPEY